MSDSEPSQALTKRSRDNELMPPPPPTKRIKRPPKVLDEDAYTNAISHIIARDFFPGLMETRSQQEYLDALESRDDDWIATAGLKLTQVMTPGPDGRRARGRRGVSFTPTYFGADAGETPRDWGGDTPASTVAASEAPTEASSSERRPDAADMSMSLSAFQAKYTSEDNESFNRLLDKQNAKRAEKYGWIYSENNRLPSKGMIAQRQREQRAITARKEQELEDGGRKQLLVTAPDDRPAKPDAWKSRPDNQLMFGPSGVEDTHETIQQKAESASRAGPRAVVYDNTRLPPPPSEPETSIPPSPSISAVQSAIAGRPRPSASEAEEYSGMETPRVNGYAFVDSEEPEPEPEPAPTPRQAELTHLLRGGDGSSNPFKLQDNSKREDLHRRMVEKVAKNKRQAKAEATQKTPVPKFPSSPAMGRGSPALMTPAAQKLLGRVGSNKPMAGGLFGRDNETTRPSGLRQRWTPTPRSAARKK